MRDEQTSVGPAVGEGDPELIGGFAGTVVAIALNGVALVGANKMRKLENYPLALTAAIVMVLPCSPCCVLSLPFGIWALVVLCDPQVRDAFT